MTRTIGISVIVVLLLSSVLFAVLGGFAKPTLSQARVPVYIIAGKSFKGKANSDTLMQLFSETKALHESKQLPGTLAAVYYSSDAEAKGKVDVWVGVLVADSTTALPAGYLFRSFPSTSMVRAEIKAHYMIAPTPDKVKTRLYEFAAEQKLVPGRYVVEKYLNEREIIMEIPVTKR